MMWLWVKKGYLKNRKNPVEKRKSRLKPVVPTGFLFDQLCLSPNIAPTCTQVLVHLWCGWCQEGTGGRISTGTGQGHSARFGRHGERGGFSRRAMAFEPCKSSELEMNSEVAKCLQHRLSGKTMHVLQSLNKII